MIRGPPRSTLSSSSAASDVYKRQEYGGNHERNMAHSAPLTAITLSSQAACTALTPLIRHAYSSISTATSTVKADKSAFTIADGLVQHLLIRHFLRVLPLAAVVGEEDVAVNIDTRPYTVDSMTVPEPMLDLVDSTREEVDRLASALAEELLGDSSCADVLEGLTAFIDPIDGTKEFATGLGEQCTVCIGFADQQGKAVAGVVFRPIPEPPSWAGGAASEGLRAGNLQLQEPADQGLLCSNGGISGFLKQLMITAEQPAVRAGGAGNKTLLLLEGKASCYIQDRGVSRWDTCAAEAVLEAHGGVLLQLHGLLQESEQRNQYTYLQSESNTDFVPDVAALTPYNSRAPLLEKAVLGGEHGQFKPYSNLLGLFAVAHGEQLEGMAVSYTHLTLPTKRIV
eukprot:TRINITY_DN17261_c0_g1_i2.p1 TRINITY_DN17261_c0_g1~~TRINITY_DN17261_c0_g1_i2.p1  ORF type:complete len:397 (-),score=109.19 TRINITY_DN17261_c0_g1_i2:128-1318(-)